MIKGTKVAWSGQNVLDLDGKPMPPKGEGITTDGESDKKNIHVLVQSEEPGGHVIFCKSDWLTLAL